MVIFFFPTAFFSLALLPSGLQIIILDFSEDNKNNHAKMQVLRIRKKKKKTMKPVCLPLAHSDYNKHVNMISGDQIPF